MLSVALPQPACRPFRDLAVYIDVGRSVDSDSGHLWKATGRIRWNQEPPVDMQFGVGDSRDTVFVPDEAKDGFIRNLTAGKRLIVEVPLIGGTDETMTFTPPAGVNPLR